MLIIARKVGTRIVIADNIVVTVLRINGGRVKLGIEAPPEVSILRSLATPDSAQTVVEPEIDVPAVRPLIAEAPVSELLDRLPREARV